MIVTIVLFHANQTGIRFREGVSQYQLGTITAFITNLISDLAWVAVPMFFLISGLLFYKNFQPTLAVYNVKLRSRLKTLVIPYLFWNICAFSGLLVVQHVGSLAPFLSGGKWAVPESGVYAIVNTIVGIDRMPILYQLWFIHDLMLLVIISPLLWLLATRSPLAGVLIFAFLWFAEGWVPLIVFNHYSALLFFYCGCLLATNDFDLQAVERQRLKLLMLFGCGMVLSACIKTMNTLDVRFWIHPGAANAWQVGIFQATRLLGVLATWSLLTFLEKKTRESLALLSAFAFVLFAGHEPTLNIVRKLLYRFVPPSGDWGVLLYYFLTVSATICMMVVLSMILRRCTPGFHRFITGDRC